MEGKNLFMATKKGLVKKTSLDEFVNIRKTGLAAINLREDDELIEVKITDNEKDVFIVTKYGQCIRFDEKDVRPTGRTSMGVRGINLIDGDEVVCGAGASLRSVCVAAQKASLSGLEFAYGIPGTVGGALYMNAGAYGGEMKDIVVKCHRW